jgi:holo-[acyl-carrier protein] synthase
MQTIRHGIDLVELGRFQQRLERYGDNDVLSTLFTDAELQYAGEGVHRIQRLAGIFAAKEAVLKALGTGWVDGIAWTDVEVGSSGTGAPIVVLHSDTASLASTEGISQWTLSISNSDSFAIASVIAFGDQLPVT